MSYSEVKLDDADPSAPIHRPHLLKFFIPFRDLLSKMEVIYVA
ncbi:hypothetical protein [Vreelandella andesensis]|nr:hypothetical protein [Halomonas andesensis]